MKDNGFNKRPRQSDVEASDQQEIAHSTFPEEGELWKDITTTGDDAVDDFGIIAADYDLI